MVIKGAYAIDATVLINATLEHEASGALSELFSLPCHAKL